MWGKGGGRGGTEDWTQLEGDHLHRWKITEAWSYTHTSVKD